MVVIRSVISNSDQSETEDWSHLVEGEKIDDQSDEKQPPESKKESDGDDSTIPEQGGSDLGQSNVDTLEEEKPEESPELGKEGSRLGHRVIKIDLDLNQTYESQFGFQTFEEDEEDDEEEQQEQEIADPLINYIGPDNSINCLLKCSRFDYGAVACLNRGFRSLIRSGQIYKLRRQYGIAEHWVYFSCQLLVWEGCDPITNKWVRLPKMVADDVFMCSDKESLGVGTDLLVLGRSLYSNIIYRYDLMTHSWSTGMMMSTPRCLFGSASRGEIGIFAGGIDMCGKILDIVEMYNSDNQTWTMLPKLNKPRKMSSGFFMDDKFYVIGGINIVNNVTEGFTCGEEYDFETKKWTVIPNMWPRDRGAVSVTMEPPPLVAVVDNELYAANHATMKVKKYDKVKKEWSVVGSLPERAGSSNGWGMAFRGCGDRIIVIAGPRSRRGGFIEVNSWVPSEGPVNWNLVARKQTVTFVYNCTTMAC